MKQKISILVFVFVFYCVSLVLGQDAALTVGKESLEGDPTAAPQILTSDLARKQIIRKEYKLVSFVFIDDDNITEILINGKSQEFEPNTTVTITKKYRFQKGVSVITVVATDEKGNKREKSFLIGMGVTKEGKSASGAQQQAGFVWNAKLDIAFEADDNPTLDLSSPVSIGDIDIQGVIPDSEQPDTRYSIQAAFIGALDGVNSFAGFKQITYSKSSNDFLNSQTIFLGAGYNKALSENSIFTVYYMFMDINVGGSDFSQNHFIIPNIEFSSSDPDGFYRHMFGLTFASKDFAGDELTDASQIELKWEYNSLDAEKMDNFRSIIALGTSDEGTEESQATFCSFDFDWTNKWESGLKWDAGFGFQYRDYKNETPLSENTGLGTTRVDFPIRISTGLGWQFNETWKAMYNYDYVFNLSNKSPYVRTIHGVTVSGLF